MFSQTYIDFFVNHSYFRNLYDHDDHFWEYNCITERYLQVNIPDLFNYSLGILNYCKGRSFLG